MKTLRADNLMKSYNGRKVEKDVSLEVNQGEIVGLLGPNGAGKTTSFYMIVGLIKPNGGNIFLDDTEITTFPMYKRAQNGIGYLAQEASVFRKLSIEDNILSVLQLTKLSKKEQHDKMESLIEEFSLGHIRKNRGDLLSGGERRRTEIARALATDPDFILLVVCLIDTAAAKPEGSEAAPAKEEKKEEAPKAEAPKAAAVETKTYATGTASPAAKKILDEKGIDAASVNGTGKDGRITKEDAVNAVPSMGTPTGGNLGT